MNKNSKRMAKLKYLYDEYGFLLDLPAAALPDEHKAKLGGGLRCFNKSCIRDKEGEKIYVMKISNGKEKRVAKRKRCGNPAVKGSFYCKKHGGGNNYHLTHGKSRNPILSLYRNEDVAFADLLEVYMQDETILDLKPELGSLRIALQKYIGKLVDGKPLDLKRFMKSVDMIVLDDILSDSEKFNALKQSFDTIECLTNGDSLDRSGRIVETISRVISRIQQAASQEQYILTPDGLKIFIRAILEVIKDNVEDESVLRKIKEGMLEISVATKGNLATYSSFRKQRVIDAEYSVEE